MTYKKWDTTFFLRGLKGTYEGSSINEIPYFGIAQNLFERFGFLLPNWRAIVKADLNASTDLAVYVSEVVSRSPFSGKIWHWPKSSTNGQFPNVFRYEHSGYISGWNLPPTVISDTGNTASLDVADQKAIRLLHKRIDEHQHQFQGGVFIGELKKAVQMVVRPGKALSDSLVRYRKNAIRLHRDFNPSRLRTRSSINRNKKEFRAALGNLYLEATFGWQPLLNDMRDAGIAAARLVTRFEKKRFKVHAADLCQISTSSFTSPMTVGNTNFYYQVSDNLDGKAEVIYYGLFRGTASESGTYDPYRNLVQLSGFDLQSFVPTVWELVPYSFVVDYFSNIGDVIQSLSHQTAEVRWLTKVTIREVKRSLICIPMLQYTHDRFDIESGGVVTHLSHNFRIEAGVAGSASTHRAVVRTPITDAVVPPLRLKFETPKPLQWLNIAVLMDGGKLPLQVGR